MPNGTELEKRLQEHVGEVFQTTDGQQWMVVRTTAGKIFINSLSGGRGYYVTGKGTPFTNIYDVDFAILFGEAPTGGELTPEKPEDMSYQEWAEWQAIVAAGEAGVASTEAQTGLTQAQTALAQQELELNQTNQELQRLQMERDWQLSQGQADLARQTEARIASIQQQQVNLQQRVEQGRYELTVASLGLDRQVAQQQAGLSQQELAQRQYEFAQGLQQAPIDWVQAWQASRGKPFEVGEQAFQMPGITQPEFTTPELPPWVGGTMPAPGMPSPTTPTPPWAGTPTTGAGIAPSGLTGYEVDPYIQRSIDAAREQYNQLVQQAAGTPLEGQYPAWPEEQPYAPTQPAGLAPIDIEVARYYGTYQGPQAGAAYPGAPSAQFRPGDVAAQEIYDQLMRLQQMSGPEKQTAIQAGAVPWVPIPGQHTTVASTPSGVPRVEGALPWADWQGFDPDILGLR